MQAPVLAKVSSLSSDDLLRFLSTQRWFAAKGASPASARVLDAVVAPWAENRFAFVRVAVEAAGLDHVYQLVCSAESLDAVGDEAFQEGLVRALNTHSSVETDDVKWVAEQMGESAIAGTARVGSAEQSNTSIIVGDGAIIKLFRTLRPGMHPDVEVTRFLTTQTGFGNTPRLMGIARFEDATGSWTAAMMQQYIAGARDAWSHALECGKPYFTAPRGSEPANAFLADAKALGEMTREMHDALGSTDDDQAFAPEVVEPEDIDRWAQRSKQMIRDALQLLEKESSPQAQALLRRRDHYLGWIDEIDDTLGDDVGMKIRVHGDYHLGQVLRSPPGEYYVIDFEGEPSRSLDERREKTSPLKDVAGMLRSFAYAAATLSMSVEKRHDMATRELRSARWERDVRAAFLDGYLATPLDDVSVLPEDIDNVKRLIGLFEGEKAFYELAYELNNRPSWAWIPMRGISKLLTAS